MNTKPKRVRTTVLLGLAFALSFIPLYFQTRYLFFGPKTVWSILAIYLLVYGFFLTRWSRKPLLRLLPPMLCLLTGIMIFDSMVGFLLVALGILSWIRSGICFQDPSGKKMAAEIVLSLGGGALVAGFAPATPFTWASGIWLFFLIQSLYFVFFETGHKIDEDLEIDRFEKARQSAEMILSDQ